MNSSRWAFELFAKHLFDSQYKHCGGCGSLTTEIVLTDCCVRDQALKALEAFKSLDTKQLNDLLLYNTFQE